MKTGIVLLAAALTVHEANAIYGTIDPVSIIKTLKKLHLIGPNQKSKFWKGGYTKNGGVFHMNGGVVTWCGAPGMHCNEKRGLEDIPTTVEEVSACGAPGNPCNTVKRAAFAIADVLDEADSIDPNEPSYCSVEGQPCHEASQHLGEITEKVRRMYSNVYAHEGGALQHTDSSTWAEDFCAKNGVNCQRGDFVGDTHVDPQAYAAYAGRLGVFGEHGTPGLAGRYNSPGAHKHGWISYYNKPSSSSHPKRDAKKPKKTDPELGFCGPHGMFCDTENNARSTPEGKCGVDGVQCHIGADAMQRVQDDPSLSPEVKACGPNATPCLITREPQSDDGDFSDIGYCGTPGGDCTGNIAKRNAEPQPFCPSNGPCISGRDAQATAHFLYGNDHRFAHKKCHGPGGSCRALKHLQMIIQRLRRDADAVQAEGITDPAALAKRCNAADGFCSVLAKKHTVDKVENSGDVESAAVRGEIACQGPNGICEELRMSLEDLQNTVDNAVQVTQ